MSAVDRVMRGCPLSCWDGSPRRCRMCNQRLDFPRTRWCSAACSNSYVQNHVWPVARDAARERDQGCVDCRATPADNPGLTEVHHLTEVRGARTQGCGHHLDGLVTLCQEHHQARHRAAA